MPRIRKSLPKKRVRTKKSDGTKVKLSPGRSVPNQKANPLKKKGLA